MGLWHRLEGMTAVLLYLLRVGLDPWSPSYGAASSGCQGGSGQRTLLGALLCASDSGRFQESLSLD